jgi:hypothetical protein
VFFLAANDQLKVWQEKCEKDLAGEIFVFYWKQYNYSLILDKKRAAAAAAAATVEKEKAVVPPPVPAKIKYVNRSSLFI